MTRSGGNGHEHDIDPDSLDVFEPAFTSNDEDAEFMGWWNENPENEEGGEFLPEHPLDEDEPPFSN